MKKSSFLFLRKQNLQQMHGKADCLMPSIVPAFATVFLDDFIHLIPKLQVHAFAALYLPMTSEQKTDCAPVRCFMMIPRIVYDSLRPLGKGLSLSYVFQIIKHVLWVSLVFDSIFFLRWMCALC